MSAATYTAEQAAIEGRLAAQWVDGQGDPLTPIAWPNVQFTPPDGPYLEARINNQQSFPREIPARGGTKSFPGLLTLNVYGALNQGEGSITALAQTAIDIFEDVTVSGIVFRSPWIANRGEHGARWRIQVDCPFERITHTPA